MEQEGIAVQVLNKGTQQVEHTTLENVQHLVGSTLEVETDRLDMILFVKDSYCVSDTAYHEMAQLCYPDTTNSKIALRN